MADSLEADWNRKLCALQEAQQQYERESQKDRLAVDEELRTRLHTLAKDFPRLWRDPNTPHRERKRLARLLLEDVTLIKKDQILLHIRFPGGTTRTLELPIPLQTKQTPRSVVLLSAKGHPARGSAHTMVSLEDHQSLAARLRLHATRL